MAEVYNLEVLLRAKQEGMGVLKEAEGSLFSLMQTALTLGAVLGGVMLTASLAAVDHLENVGHAAFDLSKAFGIAPEMASAWINAAGLVGVSAEEMGVVFKIFGKNVGESNKGAMEAFHSLGIATKDATGNFRPLSDILFDVADKFAAMPDGAEKAADGARIFGRNYAVLLPLLDQGAAGIKEAMDITAQYGENLSGPQVLAAEKAYEAHKKLDAAFAGLANTIAIALLPYVERITNWLLPNIPRFIAWASSVMDKVVPAIQGAVNWIQKILPPLEQWATQMWNQVKPALEDLGKRSKDWLPVLEALGIVILVLIVILANVVVGLIRFADWLMKTYDESIVPFRDAVVDLANNGLVALATGIETVVGWFKQLWTWASNAATAIGNAIGGGSAISGALHFIGMPGFGSGGIVPGAAGAPQVIVAHGGEAVVSRDQLDELTSLLRVIAANTSGSGFATTAYGRS